jgi:ribosomal protein S3
MSVSLIEKLKRLQAADLVKILVGMQRGDAVIGEAITRIEALEAEVADLRKKQFNEIAFGVNPAKTKVD